MSSSSIDGEALGATTLPCTIVDFLIVGGLFSAISSSLLVREKRRVRKAGKVGRNWVI